MTPFAWMEAAAALVLVDLGVLALIREPRAPFHKYFAALCFGLGVWSLGEIFVYSPSLPADLVLTLQRAAAIGWCSAPSLYVCLVLSYTRSDRVLASKSFLLSLFVLPGLCYWANWSGLLKVLEVPAIREPWGWPFLWADSAWPLVFFAYCGVFALAGIHLASNLGRKAARPVERKFAQVISVASITGLVFAALTDSLLPLLGITAIPRLGNMFALAATLWVVVASKRYRFLAITPATASENIISTMADCLILLDPEGNVVTANRAALNLLGYQEREVAGRPIEMLLADRGLKDTLLRSARRGETLTDQALFLRSQRGRPVPVSFSSSALRGDAGECAGIVCVARDMTGRMQVEEALRKAHEELGIRVEERTAELSVAIADLARAARLRDEFLASMSHELRTPLNAILGMSESLLEHVYGPLNAKQAEYLETIERSGRHLLALINDILDLAKVGAGEVGLRMAQVSVPAVCEAGLTMVRQAAHKKRLQVSCSLDEAVSTIQADERRLKQILVNLLSNAVKFTPEGGKIGLDVRGDAPGGYVEFVVWDTGVGIPPEDLDRLFQPFVQLDGGLSPEHAGTGLGLSLVRRLTELQGGEVSVESQVGKGSRFKVSIPWEEPEEPLQPAGQPTSDGETVPAQHD